MRWTPLSRSASQPEEQLRTPGPWCCTSQELAITSFLTPHMSHTFHIISSHFIKISSHFSSCEAPRHLGQLEVVHGAFAGLRASRRQSLCAPTVGVETWLLRNQPKMSRYLKRRGKSKAKARQKQGKSKPLRRPQDRPKLHGKIGASAAALRRQLRPWPFCCFCTLSNCKDGQSSFKVLCKSRGLQSSLSFPTRNENKSQLLNLHQKPGAD